MALARGTLGVRGTHFENHCLILLMLDEASYAISREPQTVQLAKHSPFFKNKSLIFWAPDVLLASFLPLLSFFGVPIYVSVLALSVLY